MRLTLRLLSATVLLSAGLALPAQAQDPAPATDAAPPAVAQPAQPPAVPEAPAPEPAPAAIPAPAVQPETPAPADAPAAAAAGLVPAPPEGKGQVVFFRPSNFVGMAVSFSVREGGKGVAKLGNGTYSVVTAEPGPHAYTIEFEAADTLNMEVEPGETYYVRQTIGMGVVAARPHLTPSHKGEFEKLKLKLSKQKATDAKAKAEKAD